MKVSEKYSITHLLLIATCVAIIGASALDTVFHFPRLNFLSEKRDPEKLPDFHRISIQGISSRTESLPNHLQAFVTDLVKSYNDNFGLRGLFVILHNAVKVLALNVSPENTPVLIGKNNWLYYDGDTAIDYYANNKNFTTDELAHWNYILAAKQKWLAKRGIYYLLVISPNKSTIYPEYMPDSRVKIGKSSLQDQLLSSIPPEMRDQVLDLRGVLRAGKKTGKVYNCYDSHWNQEGAYLVYSEIIKKLGTRFPVLKPKERSEFIISAHKDRSGDLISTLSLSRLTSEDSLFFQPIEPYRARPVDIGYAVNETRIGSAYETDDGSLPRAVIMHTSFTNSLKPFLSEHFKRSVYLFPSRLYASMFFEIDTIKQEKPDIVIEEIVERRLYRFLPNVAEEVFQ